MNQSPLQEKDDREKAELDEARQAHRDAAKAFHNIRQQRAEAYMKAFDHIKDVINPIYKDLTKSNVGQLSSCILLPVSCFLLQFETSGNPLEGTPRKCITNSFPIC